MKNKRPTWCHLLFYFTYVLNMFRTLLYPSSGACDYSVELRHWSIVLGSMCVGVSVWLGWSLIRVAGFNVVIQQNSRKLLMMDILMSETCWAHKKWNKIASDIKLVFYSSTITMIQGPINIRGEPSFAVCLYAFVIKVCATSRRFGQRRTAYTKAVPQDDIIYYNIIL